MGIKMKIEMENLNLVYPNGKQALKDISLKLSSPNMIGLLGPNGAGKSTLMKLLVAGLLPTSGSIMVDDEPLKSCENKLKSQLGYLPQTFGLYDELTVWQFLDYMAALKGINNAKGSIEQILKSTNLYDKQKTRIKALSGGQRQRVGIAQALLGNPSFLIFDEPTVGLDPEERIHFRNLFSNMSNDKLVLLSTHIIEDVQSTCNYLIVINNGKILFTGTPNELILRAQGHVGIVIEQKITQSNHMHITSQVNTISGIKCRIVEEVLPEYAEVVEPTLEDAYMYFIMQEDRG